MTPKILKVYAGALAALVIAAGVLVWHRREPAGRGVLLEAADAAGAGRIVLDHPVLGSTTLEKAGARWTMTAPIKDWADEAMVGQLLDSLSKARGGAPVSENPANYADFLINDSSATRVRVFLPGQEMPRLDLRVGKPATPLSTHVRFERDPAVYAASPFSPVGPNRPAVEYREPRLVPVDESDIVKIEARAGGRAFEVSRASGSATWDVKGATDAVRSGFAQALAAKVGGLSRVRFLVEGEGGDKLGLAAPVASLAVTASDGRSFKAEIGGPVPRRNPLSPLLRYARTEGREAPMVVDDGAVQALLSQIRLIAGL